MFIIQYEEEIKSCNKFIDLMNKLLESVTLENYKFYKVLYITSNDSNDRYMITYKFNENASVLESSDDKATIMTLDINRKLFPKTSLTNDYQLLENNNVITCTKEELENKITTKNIYNIKIIYNNKVFKFNHGSQTFINDTTTLDIDLSHLMDIYKIKTYYYTNGDNLLTLSKCDTIIRNIVKCEYERDQMNSVLDLAKKSISQLINDIIVAKVIILKNNDRISEINKTGIFYKNKLFKMMTPLDSNSPYKLICLKIQEYEDKLLELLETKNITDLKYTIIHYCDMIKTESDNKSEHNYLVDKANRLFEIMNYY